MAENKKKVLKIPSSNVLIQQACESKRSQRLLKMFFKSIFSKFLIIKEIVSMFLDKLSLVFECN